MNLAQLKKSRRRLQVGDIFVMLPPDGEFLFGRVIDLAAELVPGVACNLIYVYRVRSRLKSPVPELRRDQLLIPPLLTNRLGWSRGYFEHVENRPLSAKDRLPRHCFRDPLLGRYFDERARRLKRPIKPVGIRGLDSYRTMDDSISAALGIPLSPDD